MNKKREAVYKNVTVRAAEGDKKVIEGLIPYDKASLKMWGVSEIITRTAFNKTIADKNEVRALWNHDETKILGNTRAGTLVLESTDAGLKCVCELPDASYANDLYNLIQRGDVRSMSFGFFPVKYEDDAGKKTRYLKEVKLVEVSFGVIYPAYTSTTSQTRRLEELDLEKLDEILEKQELAEEDMIFLRKASDGLNSLIKETTEPQAPAGEKGTETEPVPEDGSASEAEKRKFLLRIETEINT
ncbi:MAG: HK97 family phage prohead protease [Treponema sp.]|nr:HK97 family phage prohead protease [Treponema sp.]